MLCVVIGWVIGAFYFIYWVLKLFGRFGAKVNFINQVIEVNTMRVAIVDRWEADFRVVIVDRWEADLLVAIVDRWEAEKRVAIVERWEADTRVAIVDRWEA